MRCAHWTRDHVTERTESGRLVIFDDSHRCPDTATDWLHGPDGARVPGAWYCAFHAAACVNEYRDKLSETWTAEPIDTIGRTVGDSCEHCPADGGGCIVCTSPNVVATAKREHAAAIRAELGGSENLTADLDDWQPAESVNEAIDRMAAIRASDKQAIGEAMIARADHLRMIQKGN